jgi:hypothetical protein
MLAAGPAFADRRVALVVGNSNYGNPSINLVNPKNDAEDIAAALRSLNFDVIQVTDARKPQFEAALQKFARTAINADSALFFYAGHAMQYHGVNYLMPVDAELQDEISLRYEMVSVDDIRAALGTATGVKIMILDACRNNPLADRLMKSIKGASRSINATRGLARIDKTQGMVVAYATAADDVALDGNGRNSPFTTALLKRMKQPGLEIVRMFQTVAEDVYTSTNGRQRPELSIDFFGDYFLNNKDRLAWERIRDSIKADDFRQFIQRFPASPRALDAKYRLDLLERMAREREMERQAAEKQIADARAKLEADRRHQQEVEAEAARIVAQKREAEEQAKLADQKRQAEEQARLAEQQRQAEEQAKLAAQQREAEEQAKLAEQQRLAEQQAQAKLAEVKRQADEQAKAAAMKRLAELQAKIAEQRRVAEEQRQALEQAKLAEQKRQAEQQAKLAEQKRQAEEQAKLAEQQRQAAAAKLAEQQRQAAQQQVAAKADAARVSAELTCQQEDERLALLQAAGSGAHDDLVKFQQQMHCDRLRPMVLAALGGASEAPKSSIAPPVVAVPAEQPKPPVAEIPAQPANTKQLIAAAQVELERLGCNIGRDDGKLNDRTRRALGQYFKHNKEPAGNLSVTESLVASLKDATGRVCPLECRAGQVAEGDRCIAAKTPERDHPRRTAHRPARERAEPRRPAQASAPRRPQPAASATAKSGGSHGPSLMGVGF